MPMAPGVPVPAGSSIIIINVVVVAVIAAVVVVAPMASPVPVIQFPEASRVVARHMSFPAVAFLPGMLPGVTPVARVLDFVGDGICAKSAGNSPQYGRDHARGGLVAVATWAAVCPVFVPQGRLGGLVCDYATHDGTKDARADSRGGMGEVVVDDMAGAVEGIGVLRLGARPVAAAFLPKPSAAVGSRGGARGARRRPRATYDGR